MVTASHLYQYVACPRWPRNELHGDPRQKRGPSAFLKKLLADGIQHEEAIYADLGPARVSYPPGDYAAGFAATIRLMRARTPLIAQAVLVSGRRMGIVDLLELRPGKSALGDFVYEPIEIKTARSVKTVYRLQLAFYAHLLADALGVWPELAHVVLADGSRVSFPLSDVRDSYERTLSGLEAVVDGGEAPVHICSTCGDCPWERSCLAEAEAARDISLTYGLTRRGAVTLREHGIATLSALSACEAHGVAGLTGVTDSVAAQLVMQARALEEDRVLWRRALTFDEADVDLYFDIEGDPEHDVMYLFGLLIRGRDGSEQYRAFVAEKPADEARAFGELLDAVEAYPGAPIYHYHHYERSAVRALSAKHGVAPTRAPAILSRMRDLNRDLTISALLPVYSYSLKAVAKYLGFQWTHPDASAAQSMFWYSSWLKSADRKFLDLAVEYNGDDCRATRLLKEWLAEGPTGTASPAPPGTTNEEPAAKRRGGSSPQSRQAVLRGGPAG